MEVSDKVFQFIYKDLLSSSPERVTLEIERLGKLLSLLKDHNVNIVKESDFKFCTFKNK